MWMHDMGRSQRLVVVATALAAAGCGGSTRSVDDGPSTAPRDSTSTADMHASDGAGGAVATDTAAPELDDQDWSKTWRVLSLPAASMNGANVVATPTGWLAVSSRGDGSKAPPEPDSVIYRSVDGTHWRAISAGAGDPKLQNAQVAYASGHYIITGSRGGAVVVFDSTDGETWREQVLDDTDSLSQGAVMYVHDRFFFLMTSFWASMDGQQWSLVDHPYDYAGISDIAYGNGRYLGVGARTLLSVDGQHWRLSPIDCSLPDACITVPDGSGTVVETGSPGVFFAEDRFYVLPSEPSDGDFSSPDGESWQPTPGFAPTAYVSGHFVQLFGPQPTVWLADRAPQAMVVIDRLSMLPTGITPGVAARWSVPLGPDSTAAEAFPKAETIPTELDFSWSDGLDCTRARCLIVGSRLLLVP